MADDHDEKPGALMSAEPQPTPHNRLLWICITLGVIAAVILLILFGWSLWTAIVIALLLACPAVVAGVLISQRAFKTSSPKDSK
jgi:uncharacterized membrane protein HdeD (DUF308 family)